MRPASLLARVLAPLFGFAALATAQVSDFPASMPQPEATRGCGTARVVQAWIDAKHETGPRASARVAATALRGRTLYTDHFALHYSMNRLSVHQVIWAPADSALRRLRDSLFTAFASADLATRDSLVHDRLDSLNAPHPLYVRKAAEYFEHAHAYYADTLGMRMPDSGASRYFGRPPRGRFSVDILDIDAATGENETYGLTFPPEGVYASPLLIENDFLYNASVNTGTGVVTGTAIAPRYNNAPLRNYNQDWDLGLAVTIAHEYYHAVQFKYTSHLLDSGYHSWYELSATGMEERLAPQVNDYFQYLYSVVPNSGENSLLDTRTLANYGNAIFHVYLTHVLGRGFDVTLWERLRNNSNRLPNALTTAFGSEARWDSLFTGYAAALAISGRPDAGASPLAFSPDMSQWPKPSFDTALAKPLTQAFLRPLTFRLIRPTATGTTWASLPGMRGGWRITESGADYSAWFLPDSILPVSSGAFAVTVANASPTQTRQMKLARAADGISAYPNPARAGAGSVNFTAPVSVAGATLTVISESGRRVAQLPLSASTTVWTWNLLDLSGRPVPPGVYYFGVIGETPRALLLLR